MKGITLIILIALLLMIVQSSLHLYSSSVSAHIPLPSVSTPAPIGIADYGISPSGAYIRKTTQWLGIVYVKSLLASSNLNNSCRYSVSFQLNVVLNYKHDNKTYALWVQDVADYNTVTHGLYFSDNIWNFSGKYVYAIGKLSYLIGKPNNVTFGQYYGYIDPNTFNYYNNTPKLKMQPPFTIELLVNVSTNDKGGPVVHFWYNYGRGWINFDNVIIPAPNSTNVYFLVDGYKYAPGGFYYDAALVIGGACDGSTAYIINGTVFLQLFYWNGHNFQEVENAYDVGYDTGETVANAHAQYYVNSSNGELYAEITAGKEDPNIFLWDEDNTTQLIIHTNISNGYLCIYNIKSRYLQAFKVPFTGNMAILTLYPFNYTVLIYQNNTLVGVYQSNAPLSSPSNVSSPPPTEIHNVAKLGIIFCSLVLIGSIITVSVIRRNA